MSLPDISGRDLTLFSKEAAVYDPPSYLRLLENALSLTGKYRFSRIVDYDINTCIDPEFSEVMTIFDKRIAKAQDLLAKASPVFSTYFNKMISEIIPIRHEENGKPKKRGFSSAYFLGAIFLSFRDRSPFRVEELVIDLAHELGHQCLMLYQMKDPILTSDLRALVYSGVRKTNRPAIMALHAAVALSFMAEAAVSMGRLTKNDCDLEYCTTKAKEFVAVQEYALSQLKINCQFTEVGHVIFDELTRNQRTHCEALRS